MLDSDFDVAVESNKAKRLYVEKIVKIAPPRRLVLQYRMDGNSEKQSFRLFFCTKKGIILKSYEVALEHMKLEHQELKAIFVCI